ncbi:MAG: hypothetical protein N3A38_14545 [Planctomycetota bacterium]|nr:hypothetical protein [Planctomycetota bacterium]
MEDKLGEMLIKAGLITEPQLRAALETQKETGGKLGAILVKLRMIKERQLVEFLGKQLSLQVLPLKDLVMPSNVSMLVPQEVIERYEVLPVGRTENVLRLAMADPLDYAALDEVRFLTGLYVDSVVAARSDIQKAIGHYFHGEPCPEIEASDRATRKARQPVGVAPAGSAKPAAVRPVTPMGSPVSGARPGDPAGVPAEEMIRALVEILVEKKIVTRDELMAKVSKGVRQG